ncbi:hypothetical protein BT93_L0843 [Corymbia citriodora subsp. variegata]|uniref:GINS subunit domain-containing protein n=1 Tax=Corymbia citriodora subsp. variegata TaxID=360336 RepID=A0A8T0CEL5_CORYI|nr:hypothetical protein BT93_L0843 [Corymbia citriodora subsp. variegata]
MSAPFIRDSSTTRAQDNSLPYHWMELSHLLITHAADDFEDANTVRRKLQELREIRMSKLRRGFKVLEGSAGIKLNGVGGMEVAEVRGFVGGVVDALRRINRSREEARRERDEEDRDAFGGARYQDDDDEMSL